MLSTGVLYAVPSVDSVLEREFCRVACHPPLEMEHFRLRETERLRVLSVCGRRVGLCTDIPSRPLSGAFRQSRAPSWRAASSRRWLYSPFTNIPEVVGWAIHLNRQKAPGGCLGGLSTSTIRQRVSLLFTFVCARFFCAWSWCSGRRVCLSGVMSRTMSRNAL